MWNRAGPTVTTPTTSKATKLGRRSKGRDRAYCGAATRSSAYRDTIAGLWGGGRGRLATGEEQPSFQVLGREIEDPTADECSRNQLESPADQRRVVAQRCVVQVYVIQRQADA